MQPRHTSGPPRCFNPSNIATAAAAVADLLRFQSTAAAAAAAPSAAASAAVSAAAASHFFLSSAPQCRGPLPYIGRRLVGAAGEGDERTAAGGESRGVHAPAPAPPPPAPPAAIPNVWGFLLPVSRYFRANFVVARYCNCSPADLVYKADACGNYWVARPVPAAPVAAAAIRAICRCTGCARHAEPRGSPQTPLLCVAGTDTAAVLIGLAADLAFAFTCLSGGILRVRCFWQQHVPGRNGGPGTVGGREMGSWPRQAPPAATPPLAAAYAVGFTVERLKLGLFDNATPGAGGAGGGVSGGAGALGAGSEGAGAPGAAPSVFPCRTFTEAKALAWRIVNGPAPTAAAGGGAAGGAILESPSSAAFASASRNFWEEIDSASIAPTLPAFQNAILVFARHLQKSMELFEAPLAQINSPLPGLWRDSNALTVPGDTPAFLSSDPRTLMTREQFNVKKRRRDGAAEGGSSTHHYCFRDLPGIVDNTLGRLMHAAAVARGAVHPALVDPRSDMHSATVYALRDRILGSLFPQALQAAFHIDDLLIVRKANQGAGTSAAGAASWLRDHPSRPPLEHVAVARDEQVPPPRAASEAAPPAPAGAPGAVRAPAAAGPLTAPTPAAPTPAAAARELLLTVSQAIDALTSPATVMTRKIFDSVMHEVEVAHVKAGRAESVEGRLARRFLSLARTAVARCGAAPRGARDGSGGFPPSASSSGGETTASESTTVECLPEQRDPVPRAAGPGPPAPVIFAHRSGVGFVKFAEEAVGELIALQREIRRLRPANASGSRMAPSLGRSGRSLNRSSRSLDRSNRLLDRTFADRERRGIALVPSGDSPSTVTLVTVDRRHADMIDRTAAKLRSFSLQATTAAAAAAVPATAPVAGGRSESAAT